MNPGGYAWWYVDALSDDGRHGLTVIAFVGSVFSPYYAMARRRAPDAADPRDHCALNVALYGAGGKRWAMTERGRAGLRQEARALSIGPSSMAWEGDSLVIRVEEICAPLPSRLRGTVRVHPVALTGRRYALDAAGRHRWQPVAPCARVEVELSRPGLRWTGAGYVDANTGDVPLERDFLRWDWSRAALAGQRTAVLFDVERADGGDTALALRFDAHGDVEPFAAPSSVTLPRTGWRVARGTRGEPGVPPRVIQTLEDTPFYARSTLSSTLLGERVVAMHESLSLTRFAHPVVQAMLPFRMPRTRR